ncbi:MAG: AbrB/MazE/SpoVT family DNA-binding domain-containing protein [Erysipelotrichaceae bacterium]|nr:AbrB/MazE/SpoVT family DNA-binding domain-containing protein [Erysipelotrichaceae bacterium]
MKATGIVRRLDDLGRLVIPKEIRKQYRIKEGDSLEFFIDNDRIIIQKYDLLSQYLEEIQIMCETLEKMYKNSVLFIQEEWLQQYPKKVCEKFIRLCHVHRVTEFGKEQIFINNTNYYSGIIYPIVSYGDWYGAFVIIYDKKVLTKEDLHAVEAFTQFLTRQQEF